MIIVESTAFEYDRQDIQKNKIYINLNCFGRIAIKTLKHIQKNLKFFIITAINGRI